MPITELGGDRLRHAAAGRLLISRPSRANTARNLCEVLWVDHYGNANSMSTCSSCCRSPTARRRGDGHDRCGLGNGRRVGVRVDAYDQIPAGRIGLVVDSSGLLSIAAARGSAALELGLGEGIELRIRSIRPTAVPASARRCSSVPALWRILMRKYHAGDQHLAAVILAQLRSSSSCWSTETEADLRSDPKFFGVVVRTENGLNRRGIGLRTCQDGPLNLATLFADHPAERTASSLAATASPMGNCPPRSRRRGVLVSLGLEPGDRVAILCATNFRFVRAWFGILGAGMVAVPLNPQAGPEIERELAWSGPRP